MPVASCTETMFVLHDWDSFFHLDQPAWKAMNAWCERHGIDPMEVLAHGPVRRDVERCRVVYVGRVGDGPHPEHDGPDDFAEFPPGWSTCYRQGETPPMPWPAELEKYRCESIERRDHA